MKDQITYNGKKYKRVDEDKTLKEFMRDTPTDAAEKQTLKNPKTGKEVTVRSVMNQGTKTYPSALVKKANAIYDKALEKERKAKNKFFRDRTKKYSFRGDKKEGVNEAGMELKKLEDAIKMFQKKIDKQGRVTNARDEDHLKNLIKIYKQMGGKGIREAMDKRQGAETLKQLGGNRFIMMTGAKHFGVGPNGMSFKIGKNSKRVNHVTIDYDRGRDLYNMKFDWVTIKGIKNKKTLKGIYADQLQDMFTRYTGMYTSL